MNLVVNMTTRNAVYVQYQFSLASLKGKNGGFALVSSVFFFFLEKTKHLQKAGNENGKRRGEGGSPEEHQRQGDDKKSLQKWEW